MKIADIRRVNELIAERKPIRDFLKFGHLKYLGAEWEIFARVKLASCGHFDGLSGDHPIAGSLLKCSGEVVDLALAGLQSRLVSINKELGDLGVELEEML